MISAPTIAEIARCGNGMEKRHGKKERILHRYSRQDESLKRPGGRISIIAGLLLSLALLLGACKAQNQNGSNQASQIANVDISNIAAFVNPNVFSQEAIKVDESGKYIDFDDMRFRVNEFETFGYKGQQWPNGLLPYDLAPEVRANSYKRSQFEKACQLLTAQSGIMCADITTGNYPGEENHVYVINSTPEEHNYAYVGRIGGKQLIGIISWHNQIVIAHEIKHTLGWEHEHQRPDRDAFVKINWDNIIPKQRHNFEVITTASTSSTYDFESTMHYGAYYFTQNNEKTIEPLPPYQNQETNMGQRNYISKIDLLEVIGKYGELGTEWCGLMRRPRRDPPEGCFFECYKVTSNGLHGRWWLCGSCRGAEMCP